MKISRTEVNNLWRGYLQRPAEVGRDDRPAQEGKRVGQGDTLSLSPQAQELQRLRQALEAVPDVRGERVRELAAAVAEGRYQVSPDAVAAQMLSRLLGDRLS